VVQDHLRFEMRPPLVDGGENPRIDGAVAILAASSGLAETMMVRG
jgi:hypothetical protein